VARASITLLITLLDDAYYLPEWVECVRRIAPDEVLVADGGSKDGGPEFLEQQELPNLRVVRRSMESFGWQRYKQLNFATALARCDWILMLDADEAFWPPRRRPIDQAIRCRGPRVISLWPARFHLWPDDHTRLDHGAHLDPQPRLWKRNAGIRWARTVHIAQTLDSELIGYRHPRAELIASPVILHRKLIAPRHLRLARHRRWLERYREASALVGIPIPKRMPDDYGPTVPLPPKAANWREQLMGKCALAARGKHR